MFVCARVHPIFFFIKYSVDWMQKFILHQFFYSYLFFKSRSFVTIEIYLQLFYEIAYSSRLIWSIASNRVKMERTRARLKLHETYNFYAVFFRYLCLCASATEPPCIHSRTYIPFVWLLQRKMQINFEIC